MSKIPQNKEQPKAYNYKKSDKQPTCKLIHTTSKKTQLKNYTTKMTSRTFGGQIWNNSHNVIR